MFDFLEYRGFTGKPTNPNTAFFKKREEPTLKHCLGRGSLRSGMGASWETAAAPDLSVSPSPSPFPQGVQGAPQRAGRYTEGVSVY